MQARLAAAALIASTLIPSHLVAQADPVQIDRLMSAMGLPDMLDIMQAEGLEYGAQIATDLFPGRPSAEWSDTVEQIYATDQMTVTVKDGLAAELAEADIETITGFFESELGQEIIELEIAARSALMDEDIEEASKEAAAIALMDETPRAALVTTFVETNDLIETNVVGAMNANYAFYIGLLDGGGLPGQLSEDEILADVWGQEPEIRQNTSEWVYSYLMLAYQPLSDDSLEAYIAFSQTDAGQDINDALFVAFDNMFEDISGALGRAASAHMIGQDL